MDGVFHVSGEITRVTDFERGLLGQVRKVANGQREPDEPLPDERWLGVHVAGKGMIVVSGCAHAGIVNVLEDCRARFPDVPIHAVIGGLHLAGVNEQIIEPTAQAMRGHDLRSINTAHRTGWRAVRALADAFGDDVVVPAAVGKRYYY